MGLFLKTLTATQSHASELEMMVVAWRRPAWRNIQFSKELWGYRSFFCAWMLQKQVPEWMEFLHQPLFRFSEFSKDGALADSSC